MSITNVYVIMFFNSAEPVYKMVLSDFLVRILGYEKICGVQSIRW